MNLDLALCLSKKKKLEFKLLRKLKWREKELGGPSYIYTCLFVTNFLHIIETLSCVLLMKEFNLIGHVQVCSSCFKEQL